MIITGLQQTDVKMNSVAHAMSTEHTQSNKTSLSLDLGLQMNPMPALGFGTKMSLTITNGQPSSQMERRMSKESECLNSMMFIDSLAQQFRSPGPNAERLLLMPQELGRSLSVHRAPEPVRSSWIEMIGV